MLLLVVVCAIIALSAEAQDVPAGIVVRPPALTSVLAASSVKLTCVAYGQPVPQAIVWRDESGTDLSTWSTNISANNSANYSSVNESSASNSSVDFPDSDATVTITQMDVSGKGIAMRLSVLEICNIDTAFTGNYTCSADNGVTGTGIAPASATFLLQVNDPIAVPPAIVVHPPVNNTVEVDTSIEFGCVAYGNPIPTISWSRPGCTDIQNSSAEGITVYSNTVMANNITMRKSVLQICNVTTAHAAEYSCWANNRVTLGTPLAKSSFQFNLTVHVPTTVPPTTRGTEEVTDPATVSRGLVDEGTIPYLTVLVVLVILVMVLGFLLLLAVIYGLKMKKIIQAKTKYSISMHAVNPGADDGAYNVTIPDTKYLVEEDGIKDEGQDG